MAKPADIEMQEMEPSRAVDIIMSREDCRDIHNKLFDRLFGRSICQWVETRPDRKALYQDLFDHAFAEINACNPNQGQEQQRFAPACRPTHITLEKEDDIPDTNPPCKYMALYSSFEPPTPGLGPWVPMFMTKEEIYDTVPAIESLDKIIPLTSRFISCLNPNYIYFRLDRMLTYAETETNFKFPDMRNAENIVQAWNKARGSDFKDELIRTFAAVACFNKFRHLQKAMFSSQLLDNPTLCGYFEDSACAMFAGLDDGNHFHDTSIQEKWRRVKNLGANLSIMASKFGGEGFLILFPFFELEVKLKKRLIALPSTSDLCEVLSNLLHSTELGCFFRSMADSIGIPVINKFYGEPSPPHHELIERLSALRLQYLLPSIARHPQWPNRVPFWCCVDSESRRLAPGILLSPLTLTKIAAGDHLEPDVVEHLIRQQLPREWTVLGKEDISRHATKELLLCDYKGIMIPLFINGGWTLFCYTNPIRSEVVRLVKFVDPTKNRERYIAASKMLSTWIPRDAPWVPQGLRLQLIEPVHSQNATETDSGIHVVIDAIAMAKTGKPEARTLNRRICKGLRIKYFVHLLNELQEAANKVNKLPRTRPAGLLPPR